MSKMGRTRVWMCCGLVLLISCFVAGSANAGLFGLFGGKSSRGTSSVKMTNLVIFPLDQSQEISSMATMGEDIASALRTELVGNKRYLPTLYRDKLAPIKRARADSVLKPKEDASPFSEDRNKPLKLARLLAADYFVVGTIEDVSIDAGTKVAQISLSMELVDANTGKLVKAMLVTGRTPGDATSASQEDAIALAAGDAVAKLRPQLLEDSKSAAPAEPSKTSAEAPKTKAPETAKQPAPARPARAAAPVAAVPAP